MSAKRMCFMAARQSITAPCADENSKRHKMKKLLKLYKMFYRLLRLKAWQRREIEIHNRSATVRILDSAYNEYFAVKTELDDYKKVMLQYRINSPLELLGVLEGLPIVCNSSKTDLLMLKDLLEPHYRSQTIIKHLSENTCPTGNP